MKECGPLPVTLSDIEAAATRIAPFVKLTPVLTSQRLDVLLGAEIFFKCENFQRVCTFKTRGAHNEVFALDDAAAASIVAERGATLIHPYDNLDVIAGQGTAMVEFIGQVPGLDVIMAPVGGGGLMAGTSIAARGLKPGIRIIATEPEQADDAFRSWKQGELINDGMANTIADGLRTSVGSNGYTVMRALLDEFATVSEDAIIQATRLVWEVLKIVIEPSSAVPVAALLEGKVNLADRKVGIILSGGNVDLDWLPWQPAQP